MPISEQQFKLAAQILQCDVAAVKAVAEVESRGNGFDPEGFPKTLFEGHWFFKYTKGKYATSHPSLCYKTWTKAHYGKTWQVEKDRLSTAMTLDRTSAMLSASWGGFQIMGFNFAQCGYKTVQQFVTDMCKSEDAQLLAFVEIIKSFGLADELRNLDFDSFAYRYNGVDYKKNDYAGKLLRAYKKYKATPVL